MYDQRRGGKFHVPDKQLFFSCHFVEIQLLYEMFQDICWWNRIQRVFLHKKTYNCENGPYPCRRWRKKKHVFNPFSSTSSEISSKILKCLINSPVRIHWRKPHSVPFRTVVFLFPDSKPYMPFSQVGWVFTDWTVARHIDFHECTA